MSLNPKGQEGRGEGQRFSAGRSHEPYESFNVDPEFSSRYPQVGRQSSSYSDERWSNYGYSDAGTHQANQLYDTHDQYAVERYNINPNPLQSSSVSPKKENEKIKSISAPTPHRPNFITQKNSHKRWFLTKELQPFVTNTATDTLLLLDDHNRVLCASKEMGRVLQSLKIPYNEDQERLKGIITVSKDGRWFALISCVNREIAKSLELAFKDEQKDLVCKFVSNAVFCTESEFEFKKGILTLSQDLHRNLVAERVLIDEWTVLPKKSVNQPNNESLIEKITLPESVSKDISIAKKAADHIKRWSAQQEGGFDVPMKSKDEQKGKGKEISNDRLHTINADGIEFDYLDEEKKTCLLCQRQFKSLIVLRKHSIESDLHRRNLQDSEQCSEGRKRKRNSLVGTDTSSSSISGMKKAGFTPIQKEENDHTHPKLANEMTQKNIGSFNNYRDRAAERRIVFGTEAIAKAKAIVQNRNHSNDLNASDSCSTISDTPIKLDESNSIGGALLAKMGWNSGKGLGMNGEGIIDPIPTHVYTPGAGIGSRIGNKAAITVEEHSNKQTKFIRGDFASQRSARMRDRYDDDEKNVHYRI